MEINKGLQARTLSYCSVLQFAAKKLVECGVTTFSISRPEISVKLMEKRRVT